MTLPASLLRIFGRISLLFATAGLASALLGWYPEHRSWDSYLFIVLMLAAVSAALVLAGRLRERNDPLADRAVPSSLVAYLLFILMALRWLLP
ncbi:hypothetical protein [Motiliproteus sediminis]|uniref:hypothetical protein n=1 Tax=Motiliproteus sediminis TaxID=1468178 RepID=UPI001AEF4F45|nr:hypothetical protein [Motiliproteus sediminis]